MTALAEKRISLNLNQIYNSINTKEIRTALFNTFVSEKHVDYIKEDDFYNAIEALDITGIKLLGVNLKYNNSNVNYIEIPSSRIPELTNVIFTPVSQE